MIESCPVCRYSLRGLPAEGRCPECSFAYDETTFVVRQDRLGWIIVLGFNGITFGLGLSLWFWDPPRFSWNVLTAFGLPALAGWLMRLLRRRTSIVVSGTQLHVLRGTEVRASYLLCDFRDAHWSDIDGAVELNDSSGAVVRLPRRLLWSHKRARNLVNELNSRLNRLKGMGSMARNPGDDDFGRTRLEI